MTAPVNALGAQSLSQVMAASIPVSANPQLNSAFDAIALACHAGMLAVGFRLIGLGEDHKIEAHSDNTHTQPLPEQWNALNGSYAFRYAHSQSSMEYLLKVSRMGSTAVVMGMAIGDDKTCTFDVKTQEFVSDGNLPATPVTENSSSEEIAKKIQDVFISAGRLSDLGSLLQVKLIQKLAPAIHKEGYEETGESRSAHREPQRPAHDPLRDERDPPARPYPLHDPFAQPRQPRGPMPDPMPGFEDEYETLRPPRGGLPGAGYPRIGDRDLYPQGLGPNDPMRGGLGPGLGGPRGGGGMHPTFDDPLFAAQGQRGSGYNPQVPPGSRYDPVGPGMGGHPRGAGMGGRPPNPFGGPPNPFGGFSGDDFI
ncbi:Hypothetical protein R9X50_00751000 [Acrodontium crateriforme]|uniref:Proteasome inhibitor PI31 subunit n=1 Tax=Acrodontium crateriforme TaxID=150365 RepID=A0AAQ3RE70_9PEZI|nr:Hypothetical protein R9X50_00751000 [Acrodontium crateriforme]